jgi:hypothetical protein
VLAFSAGGDGGADCLSTTIWSGVAAYLGTGLILAFLVHTHYPGALGLREWIRVVLRLRRERPRHRSTAEQRDEVAAFQLIEWHSAPASQGQIAGYRIDHNQSADILNLVNRWPVPPKHHQG